MEQPVVVVGAGHAGGEVVFRLRQGGFKGPIRLIGTETHRPYQRPFLSKSFLAGQIEQSALLLRPETSYAKAEVTFTGQTTVARIDPGAHAITLGDGTVIPYGQLVLATGGRVRRLSCPGADLDGVFYLRTIDDVDLIRAEMGPGRRLVIIGGGYVGLEVAAVAVKQSLDVTVIEAAPRVLARVAGAEISTFYEMVHREAGVVIHTGTAVASLSAAAGQPDRVAGVVLADGTTLPADMVLAGIGLLPNVELAAEAGLKVDNGIWVDEYCRTDDPDILAIGDCANHPSPLLGRRLRLESVPNAVEQARVAAETICGRLSPYAAVPWFWSDQYDLKLQAVGLAEGHDQVVRRGAADSRAFTMFYLRQGVVIATDSVNRAGDFVVSKRLVGQAMRADPARLGDLSVPLKDLAAAA